MFKNRNFLTYKMFAFIKAGNLKTNIADDEAEGQLHVMFSGQFFHFSKPYIVDQALMERCRDLLLV